MRLVDPPDLASLLTLDALLTEGGVSAAAKKLGLSTPAVSHALHRLRTRFDDPLLVRSGNGMVRTARAEALRPKVRAAMASIEAVFEAPDTVDLSRVRRSFTIFISDYVTTLIGPDVDQRIQAEAPHIDLRLMLNTPQDPDLVRNGDADLVVGIYGRLPPEAKRRKVISDRLITVVRSDHPHVQSELTLKQYVALPHIQVAPRGRPGGGVDRVLAEMGLERRVARAVPFFRHGMELAAATDYLLTIPERLARRLAPGLGLRILEPPLKLRPYALSMVWHPRFDGDGAHRFIRDTWVEAFRSAGGVSHELVGKPATS